MPAIKVLYKRSQKTGKVYQAEPHGGKKGEFNKIEKKMSARSADDADARLDGREKGGAHWRVKRRKNSMRYVR